MSDKAIALVTGANKGIGFEIARQLGNRGMKVWLGCRDVDRGQAAESALQALAIDARAVMLDVRETASICVAANEIRCSDGHLDVLINNAGVSIGLPMTVLDEPIDDIATMFDVNALGPLRVTRAFAPLLRKSSGASIVMMSSALGSIGDAADITSVYREVVFGGYSATKSALNMLTVKLAKELLADGIKVNAIDPGYTATDMNGHSGPRSVDEAAAAAVELALLRGQGPTGGFFNDGHLAKLARLSW